MTTTPILTTAEEEMRSLIDGMTSDSYNYDWAVTNEEDLARIKCGQQTAKAVIYWDGEENTDSEDGVCANAYANLVNYRIRVTTWLDDSEPEFPRQAKRYRLRLALDDLKALFGEYYHLESEQLFIMYAGCEAPEVRQQGDILVGEMDTFWRVRYYQDRETPTQVAGA